MKELEIKPLGTVSPYCFKNKNCSGYLIEYNNKKYLLDAGNGITNNMTFPNDFDNLKILISHLHPDHYGDLSAISQAALVYQRMGLIGKNIDVYIPKVEEKTIIDYEYIHSLEKKYPVNIIDYKYIDIQEDDLTIKTMKVPHSIDSNAFRIDTSVGSVAYSSDTGRKNDLREFAKYVDLFICESTFLRGQFRMEDGHLYAFDAGKIAYDAKVDKLLLTHFWPHINKEIYVNEAKEYFTNTDYAEENKKLILKK